MGGKLKRTKGKNRATEATRNAMLLVQKLPQKHAKGAAVLASQLAPRSQIDYPGYVHMQDAIKAKLLRVGQWAVEVAKDYGIYVEMGTIFMDAIPFFRPAMASAIRAMKAEMRTVVKRARR